MKIEFRTVLLKLTMMREWNRVVSVFFSSVGNKKWLETKGFWSGWAHTGQGGSYNYKFWFVTSRRIEIMYEGISHCFIPLSCISFPSLSSQKIFFVVFFLFRKIDWTEIFKRPWCPRARKQWWRWAFIFYNATYSPALRVTYN